MDIYMAEMDGIEATKIIKDMKKNVNTPVYIIICSAYTEM